TLNQWPATFGSRLNSWKFASFLLGARHRAPDGGGPAERALLVRRGRAAFPGGAVGGRGDQGPEVLDRHGAGEEVALRLVAAVQAQELDLGRGLDALGDHGGAQGARHLDDGAHDRRVARLAPDAGDEGAVDLERRHRKAREVREARVAGAEVVDRDADA